MARSIGMLNESSEWGVLGSCVAFAAKLLARCLFAVHRFLPPRLISFFVQSPLSAALFQRVQRFLYKGSNVRRADGNSFEYRGLQIFFADNEFLPFYVRNSGYFDFDIDAFLDIIHPGDVVCDGGANVGLYALLAAVRTGPAGSVLCLEPESGNAALLERNIAVNAIGNVRVERIALSDHDGEGALHLADNAGHHTLAQGGEGHQDIPLRTLDTLTGACQRVDVVKLDIEGADFLALRGMERTLARNPGLRLFVEYNPAALLAMGDDPLAFLSFLFERFESVCIVDTRRRRLVPAIYGGAEHRHLLEYHSWMDLWSPNLIASGKK